MRTLTRTVVPTVLALGLSVALAIPASASRSITYGGHTSASSPNRFRLEVVKKDNGRRFLRGADIEYTATCEDASTSQGGFGFTVFGGGGGDLRIGANGELSTEQDLGDFFLAIDGVIGFRHAEGTMVFSQADLTDDHQDAQLCTTGELTWTAERKSSRPLRLMTIDAQHGKGFVEVRSNQATEWVTTVES
jgi:hypothetical protein